jgi:hypothetical protein
MKAFVRIAAMGLFALHIPEWIVEGRDFWEGDEVECL